MSEPINLITVKCSDCGEEIYWDAADKSAPLCRDCVVVKLRKLETIIEQVRAILERHPGGMDDYPRMVDDALERIKQR